MLRALAALLAVMAAVATPAAAFPNGQAPRSALARIYSPTPSVQPLLERHAAAAWNTMVVCAYDAGVRLYPGGPLSAYRSYAGQVTLRNYWTSLGHPENAALPGTSNHGLGLAVDLAQPGPMRRWIDAHGATFGWQKKWSDAPWEPWHIKYRAGVWHVVPNPGPYPHSPRLVVGSRGTCLAVHVRGVQRALGQRQTGVYTRSTRAAVIRFQRRHRIPASGVMTPGSWTTLRHALAAQKRPVAKPKPRPKAKPKPAATRPAPAYGVDVSQYQGAINWTAVKKAGYRFAIVKATEGLDYRDPTYDASRVRAMHVAGLVVGVYHFMRPRPGRLASSEARFAVATARAAGWNPSKDLPLVEDLEASTLSSCATATYGHQFAATVRKLTGRWPILYSFPGFLNAMPASCRTQLAGLRLHIAHYRVSSPLLPSPWRSYALWQFNDSASVPGIHGHVDVDLVAGGVPALLRLAP